jgi:hypothetical protein
MDADGRVAMWPVLSIASLLGQAHTRRSGRSGPMRTCEWMMWMKEADANMPNDSDRQFDANRQAFPDGQIARKPVNHATPSARPPQGKCEPSALTSQQCALLAASVMN